MDLQLDSRRLSVAVIGAGAAGLITTRELLREGHNVTVFEQNDTIGGIWNYQEEYEADDLLGRDPNRHHVHSSMYSTLRTNLPRQIMSFSDFPFIPEVMGDKSHDSRRFCHHTEVLAWLGVFATTFDLCKHIQFSTKVTSLQPLTEDTRTSNGTASVSHQPAGPQWRLKHVAVPQKGRLQHQANASANRTAAAPSKPQQSLPATDAHQHGQTDLHSCSQAQPPATARTDRSTARVFQEPTANGAASNGASIASNTNDSGMANGQNSFRSSAHTANGLSSVGGLGHGNDVTPADGAEVATDHTSGLMANGASAAHVQEHEQVFDAVVCCVGNYHQPNLPHVEGLDSFPGLQMHAHNYRTNAIFAGKNVMVIGSSFSGEEIARLVANVAAHVYHSARSFAKQALLRGNLTRVTMLAKLNEHQTATLQDGAELDHIDAIIYCTGYQYAYPFLKGTNLIKSQDMRVDPLWMHIFPPSVAPSLAFVGLLWKSLRNWQFQLQAKLVARVLSGRSQLPSKPQMEQDVIAFYKLLEDSSVPVRYTHNQEDGTPVDQFVYNAELARLCGPGARTHPDWIKSLYVKHVGGNILRKPDTFRDTWDDIELETFGKLDDLCAEMLANLREADKGNSAHR